MMHRKHGQHTSRDILVLTMKNLSIKEGFFCTKRTYGNIKDRINEFKRSRSDLRIETRPWGAVVNVRRVA